ncbi:MAG: hypothetical protein ACXWZF_01460 [Actinomycetota bacterium]
MGLRDEIRDPWVYILGGLAGGIAWAVGVPVGAAAGVGAAVAGVRAGFGALLGGEPPTRTESSPLPVTERSPEQAWLERGESAVRGFRDLAGSLPEGLASTRSESIATQADETLEGMRRLAGQASVTERVSGRLHEPTLAAEAERLRTQIANASDPEVAQERSRSLGAIQEQIDIARRLRRSHDSLLARLESSAIGLERLTAQLAEVVALSEGATTAVEGTKQLESLADDLEGLRAGLAEAEQLSRRALSAYEAGGSVGDAN